MRAAARLVPIVLGSLVIVLVPAMPGGASPARVAHGAYDHVAAEVDVWRADCSSGRIEMIGVAGIGRPYEVVRFATRPGERWVRLRVDDTDAASTVIGSAYQRGADPASGRGFCGATSRAVRITGGRPLYVSVFSGVSGRGPSVLTTGVVTASFSR